MSESRGGVVSDGQDQSIIDDYKLITCIASGNDSQVWEVTETATGNRFAMKLLLPEALKVREKVQTLKREGKAGASFDHPNLITVHSTVVKRQHAYLIMDFFRSNNLKSQILGDLHSVHLRMKRLTEQVCQGLAYMHDKGWLHRDIKPDNILINRASEVRIIDFSLSGRIATGLGKMFGGKAQIQGTKSYIAPETLLKKTPTPQTDMYSLGVTFYLCLTGEYPITGITPSELLKNHLRLVPPPPSDSNPNVTPEMDEFVGKLLAKKPANRFRSMDEAYSIIRSIPIFKEDVAELKARKDEQEREWLRDGVDAARRLDSRSDAERSALLDKDGGAAPQRPPERKAKPQPKPQQAPPQSQPVATQPQQQPAYAPPAPQQPQQPPAGYPMAPPPGYAPAGYPQQPMPVYPGMPMQPYAAMPPQPYPAAPPQPGPPAAAPQQPNQYPQQPQQPPVAQQPPPSAPAPSQPSPEKPKEESPDDDLPLMEDLPDVL